MLYICANVLGCMYHIFADKRHRTAFLLTKGSLAVSITIEEKSKEQVISMSVEFLKVEKHIFDQTSRIVYNLDNVMCNWYVSPWHLNHLNS